MTTTGDLIAHDISELPAEDFNRYVELVKEGTLESIAAANSIWPEARKNAAAISEMLQWIRDEPTPKQRREIRTEIERNETRLQEIREKISELKAAKFRLESQLGKLRNSRAIQQTSPVHGFSLRRRLNNQVLKAAVLPELQEAGLYPKSGN